MKVALRAVAGAMMVALGTWTTGWYVPAVWGAVVGFGWPARRPARWAAADGALGWAGILLLLAVRGDPLGTFTGRLAGAMHVPGIALVLATLLFPAVLGASAAWLAAVVRGVWERRAAASAGALGLRPPQQ